MITLIRRLPHPVERDRRALDERASLALWPHVHDRYAEAFGIFPAIGRVYAERVAS